MAHRLKRRWIGIDITYQSIALILKRLDLPMARADAVKCAAAKGDADKQATLDL